MYGNACTGNVPGAGILATSDANRIENNNVTDNQNGIDIDGAGNFIIRNVCSDNVTNWQVAANNVVLVITAGTAAAFTGDNGGASPGSTNPFANFTY